MKQKKVYESTDFETVEKVSTVLDNVLADLMNEEIPLPKAKTFFNGIGKKTSIFKAKMEHGKMTGKPQSIPYFEGGVDVLKGK